MIKPRRIGHATFETRTWRRPSPTMKNSWAWFWRARKGSRAFLATKIGQLVIELNKADRAHCIKLAFEVAPNSDFGELARGLSRTACAASCATIQFPAWARCWRSRTTKARPSSCSRTGAISASTSRSPASARSSSDVFFTPDIQRTVSFYEKVLGFRVSDWIGDFFCFMRCNTDHHTVNFFTGPDVKLHHIAFELKDFMHLQNSCEIMGQQRVPIIWGRCATVPGTTSPPIIATRTIRWSSSSASSIRWWTRSSAISSLRRGTTIRRNVPSCGRRARPRSGGQRPRTVYHRTGVMRA